MLNLIDQHQISVDTCSKLIDALTNRIYADSDDDQQESNHLNSFLFVVSLNLFHKQCLSFLSSKPMSERIFTFLEQLKTIPHDPSRDSLEESPGKSLS